MSIREQFRNITPIIIISIAATTALLSIVILLGIEFNIELDHFTQDPTAIMNAPFYLGFFSDIGILLWCGSVVFCFFTKTVLPKSGATKQMRNYLLYSGLISALLMFDDLFLLHEEAFPKHLGIPENGVYVIYANILIIYLLMFRQLILETEYVLLGMGFLFIGISTVVDLVPMPIPEDSFLEDTVKLFGIVCWFIYFMRLCYGEIKKAYL